MCAMSNISFGFMLSSFVRCQCIPNSLRLGDAPSQVTAINFNEFFSIFFIPGFLVSSSHPLIKPQIFPCLKNILLYVLNHA